MVLRYFLLSCALLMTAACASNDSRVAQTKENAGEEDIICTRERTSGSNIPRVVCRTLEEIEAERLRTQEEMRQMSSQN